MATQTVGLFEAKTRLSELVARAEQGEEVVITRHNRPVARIVPLRATERAPAARRAALKSLLQTAARRRLGMDWKEARDEGRK